MAKFPLDLASFKKAKEDAKSTTLEHKDGHTIILAHGKLPAEHQKMLKALPLADGGKIPGGSGSPATDDEKAKQIQDSSQQSGWQPKQWAKNLKEGLGIASESKENAMAKGGEVEHCKCDVTEGDNPQCPKHKPRKALAEGGGPEEAPTEQEAAATDMANSPEMQGEMEAQAGDSAPGTPAPLPPESAQQVAPTPPTPPSVSQELLNGASNYAEDIRNGHVTSKHYKDLFWDKGFLGKMGTIFGMALSGMGSGLTGQPNALLSLMDKEIDRDRQDQIANKGNALTFLKIHQQQQMNEGALKNMVKQGKLTDAQADGIRAENRIKAITATKMDMTTSVLHHALEKANMLPQGNPMKAKADGVVQGLAQHVAAQHQDLANKAESAINTIRENTQDPEKSFQDENFALTAGGMGDLADYRTARHIPGVPGQATGPVSEDMKGKIRAMTILDNKGKDVLNYIEQHSGTWNPQTKAVATQKIEEMKNFYNDSIGGGTLTNGRLGWYDEQFAKNPTDILSQVMGSTAKLREMVNSNATRRATTLKSLGIDVPETPKEGSTAFKKGKPIVFKDGKWQFK